MDKEEKEQLIAYMEHESSRMLQKIREGYEMNKWILAFTTVQLGVLPLIPKTENFTLITKWSVLNTEYVFLLTVFLAIFYVLIILNIVMVIIMISRRIKHNKILRELDELKSKIL